MSRTIRAVAAVAAVGGLALAGAGTAAAAVPTAHAPRVVVPKTSVSTVAVARDRARHIAVTPIRRVGPRLGTSPLLRSVHDSQESTNWSGYVESGSFTSASATWTVPSVQPASPTEYSAAWVGVDGASDSSLIQTGTGMDSDGQYYAWWEILPAAATPIDEPVLPGDVMSGSVSEVSTGVWNITLTDHTRNWTYNGNHNYGGPGTSAEWILEAPTVSGGQSALADYGQVGFSSVDANGTGAGLVASDQVDMIAGSSGAVISSPSVPDATGTAFSVTYGPVAGSPSATPVTATPPTAPQRVRVHRIGRRAVVTWSPPADTFGEPVTGYLVRILSGGRVVQTFVVPPGYAGARITGLARHHRYGFSVAATTPVGRSGFSSVRLLQMP